MCPKSLKYKYTIIGKPIIKEAYCSHSILTLVVIKPIARYKNKVMATINTPMAVSVIKYDISNIVAIINMPIINLALFQLSPFFMYINLSKAVNPNNIIDNIKKFKLSTP